MKTYGIHKPHIICFKIDDRPQDWIRYGSDISAVRDSALDAIRKEWPGRKLSQLTVRTSG